MIKPISSDVVGENWYNLAKQQISDSQIVCIYGMSIGNSDSFWWEHIASWLAHDATHHLLIFWYEESSFDSMSIVKLYRRKENVIKKIITHAKMPDEMIQKIRKRIHIVFNTKTVLQANQGIQILSA